MATLSTPVKGDASRRSGAHFEPLSVRAQESPNMTVKVSAGAFQLQNSQIVEYSGGNSASITAPGSNARWTAICITSASAIVLVNGTASVTPQQPTIPTDYLLLAYILVQSTTTFITNNMIYDVRPLFRVGSTNHATLDNRNAANAHTIAAITGLQDALDAKRDGVDIDNDLALKADTTGTPSNVFTLNTDETGVPTANCSLAVERGTEATVRIRWNETFSPPYWEFTNDGSTYAPIGASEALPLAGGTMLGDIDMGDNVIQLTASNPTGNVKSVINVQTGSFIRYSVYGSLAGLQTQIPSPTYGATAIIAGQGMVFFDNVISPAAWVLAADGTTLAV